MLRALRPRKSPVGPRVAVGVLSFAAVVAVGSAVMPVDAGGGADMIYATCWAPDHLVTIDDAAPTAVQSTIVNGTGNGHFNAVAVNPSGTRVYKTNRASNSVSVIDAFDDTVIVNVAVMGDPRMVEVSPDGLHY